MVEDSTPNDALVPLVQIRSEDIGAEFFPPERDLLQVLWNPRLVQNQVGIEFQVYWRSSSEDLVVMQPPTPSAPDEDMLPQECSLSPEEVLEYPAELPGDLDQELEAVSEAIGGADVYYHELACAPGLKIGGYPDLPSVGPIGPVHCREDHECTLLLTVDGAEWSSLSQRRWRATDPARGQQIARPTGLVVGRDQRLAIFVCRHCDGWPSQAVVG
jgi:hypothetical protein